MAVGSISSGSALDVNGIVTQLMQVERQPLAKLQSSISGVQTTLSAWSKVQSATSALKDAAQALTRSDTWTGTKTASANEAIVAAAGSSSAAAGRYSIQVNALARTQSAASAAFASNDTVVGAGSMTIQLGSVDDASSSFTADPDRKAITLNFDQPATLDQVRAAINNANAGVTASIVDDGSGKRLVLSGKDTGQKNAFSISATDAAGNPAGAAGLSSLAFDPTVANAANGMTRTQTASDARLSVNGLAIRAQGNHIENAVQGLTLDLKKVDSSPVEVTVDNDKDGTKSKIDNFVKAYNDLAKQLADQTKYDPATKKAGELQGDAIAVRVQSVMRQTLQTVAGQDGLDTLSKAGISITRDGTLAVDQKKMDAALATPDKLRALFNGAAAGSANATTTSGANADGVAGAFYKKMSELLDSTGPIQGANDTLNARRKRLEDQQTRMQDKLVGIEDRLRKQYTALDVKLSKMQNLYASISRLG